MWQAQWVPLGGGEPDQKALPPRLSEDLHSTNQEMGKCIQFCGKTMVLWFFQAQHCWAIPRIEYPVTMKAAWEECLNWTHGWHSPAKKRSEKQCIRDTKDHCSGRSSRSSSRNVLGRLPMIIDYTRCIVNTQHWTTLDSYLTCAIKRIWIWCRKQIFI